MPGTSTSQPAARNAGNGIVSMLEHGGKAVDRMNAGNKTNPRG